MSSIKVQAPTRISLVGGGSDLPIFYEQYGGAVVSMAINLYQRIEISTIKNRALAIPENASFSFYNEFFKFYGIKDYSIRVETDAPIQSGLGSSASAAVALVKALSTNGQPFHKAVFRVNNQKIVEVAWEIETQRLGLYGGKQDQVAAAYGGFNLIEFNKEGFKVTPYSRPLCKYWQKRMLLIFTGKVRKNPKIQEELKVLDSHKIEKLQTLRDMVYETNIIIKERAFDVMGLQLNEAWETKKALNPLVTNKRVDKIYEAGIKAGAIGGKLLGSGGGGFMLFLVDPLKKEKVVNELEKIEGVKHYPFNTDWKGVLISEQ